MNNQEVRDVTQELLDGAKSIYSTLLIGLE